MSATIAIDRLALQSCFTKLASVALFEEDHGRSSINIWIAVRHMTYASPEVEEMWIKAQADALVHHRDVVPKIHALREQVHSDRSVPPKTQL